MAIRFLIVMMQDYPISNALECVYLRRKVFCVADEASQGKGPVVGKLMKQAHTLFPLRDRLKVTVPGSPTSFYKRIVKAQYRQRGLLVDCV